MKESSLSGRYALLCMSVLLGLFLHGNALAGPITFDTALPGVKSVQVELAKGEAIVEFAPEAKVTDEQIQKAVRDAGFTPGKIEWK